MNAQGIGFVTGIIVGLILIVVLFKYANTNRKVMTEYDERQELVRGKGYKYAFYTALAVQALLCCASICKIEIPIEDYVLHFIGILCGCLTLGSYCIWNDVYWGMNNDRRRYGLIFAIAIFFNLLAVVGPAMAGSLFETNGKIGIPVLNIIVLIMLSVFGIEYLIKKAIDNKKVGTEEEED